MSRAYYLDYPTSLHQTGADRGRLERCLASLAYRDLCRLTLQKCHNIRLADANFPGQQSIVARNPEARAVITATLFFYLIKEEFTQTTELNGPILDFANEELVIFISWLNSRQIPFPVSANLSGRENVQRLTAYAQQWIGSVSPADARSRWFAQTMEIPQYAVLRNDLIHFTGI